MKFNFYNRQVTILLMIVFGAVLISYKTNQHFCDHSKDLKNCSIVPHQFSYQNSQESKCFDNAVHNPIFYSVNKQICKKKLCHDHYSSIDHSSCFCHNPYTIPIRSLRHLTKIKIHCPSYTLCFSPRQHRRHLSSRSVWPSACLPSGNITLMRTVVLLV
jgi:hypothetical protein